MFWGVPRPLGFAVQPSNKAHKSSHKTARSKGPLQAHKKPTKDPQETHKGIYSSLVTPRIPAVRLLSRPIDS